MLVQLGRQMILWPHHQVGLQWTKSPPIDAQLRQQYPCLVSAHSPMKMEGSTISPCWAHIWGKEAIFTSRRRFPNLNKAGKKIIQEVCGVFLFLARAVDGGLLPGLSSLASQKANQTEKIMELCKQFLDYMVTQEDAILTYRASNMVLAIHSNASSCKRTHVHGQKGWHTLQQWRRPQYLANKLSSHVIHIGGRIWCPFHQC